MSKSLRSDPRRIRAARRASLPVVRAKQPRPGRYHPATPADVRAALAAFGEETYYGLTRIELVPCPAGAKQLMFGRLAAPGHILLFDQPKPPWRTGLGLARGVRQRLVRAGATIDQTGVVHWPGDTLRRFMVCDVLAHEVGHHVLQHERRLRGERGARTRDHEARAEAIADRLRAFIQ